jgi:hypothetical protein
MLFDGPGRGSRQTIQIGFPLCNIAVQYAKDFHTVPHTTTMNELRMIEAQALKKYEEMKVKTELDKVKPSRRISA